jgi:BASS family bile acid:Na+ symporter
MGASGREGAASYAVVGRFCVTLQCNMSQVKKVIRFLKDWALPLGMSTGAAGYLLFHFIPALSPLKPLAEKVSTDVIPLFIFLMLFFTFCKINPRDLLPRRWHVWLLLAQIAGCFAVASLLHFCPALSGRLFWEGFLVCIICPTAAAAAVVTGKLGGSEGSLTTYTILSNTAAAVCIPITFPMVETVAQGSFISQFVMILLKIFPLLILPLICAWAVRLLLPRVNRFIVTHLGNAAFYLWSFNLIIVVGQAMRSMVNSTEPWSVKIMLAMVGLLACIVFFFVGKNVGARYGESISAGQAFGQKNNVFAIWVAYMYLPPVVMLAPSSYIIWQNIFNSWQINRKQKRDRQTASGKEGCGR